MTPFLLRLSNLPHPEPANDEEARLIEQFARHAKGAEQSVSQATPEQFFTQATILDAAVREVTSDALWVDFGGDTVWNERGMALHRDRLPEGTVTFGSTDHISQENATPERGWWLSRTIQDSMTYETIACSYDGTGRDIRDVMTAAARAGRDRVWVRFGDTEHMGAVPVSEDREENNDTLIDEFGWRLFIHSRGVGNLIVTPLMEPSFEYRVWVVNGAVVTGAGIVPTHDPRFNLGFAFDLQCHERLGDGEVISATPGHVEMLVELARTTAQRNLADDGDLPASFVLDLAWDGFVPTIVDVNSITGTALYAADPARIIRALIA